MVDEADRAHISGYCMVQKPGVSKSVCVIIYWLVKKLIKIKKLHQNFSCILTKIDNEQDHLNKLFLCWCELTN